MSRSNRPGVPMAPADTGYATISPKIFAIIEDCIANNKRITAGDSKLAEAVRDSADFEGVAIGLYEPNNERLLVVRRILEDKADSIRSAVNRILKHPRFTDFSFSRTKRGGENRERAAVEESPQDQVPQQSMKDSNCRVQVDFLSEMVSITGLGDLHATTVGTARFEFGVDGLRLEHSGKVRYLLPGDCFVFSILGLKQLAHRISKLFPGVDHSELEVSRFRSKSFISCRGDGWQELYRGYPVMGPVTLQDMFDAGIASIDNVLRTQKSDGRFEYYYDVATDSRRNHEHPHRNLETNPYYNMLRHSGGILTLLFCATAIEDPAVIEKFPQLLLIETATNPVQHREKFSLNAGVVRIAIEKSIQYFLTTLVSYSLPDGQPAAYGMCNRKAKLGGAGLGLYSLTEYRRHTGDSRYDDKAAELANHLISEIQPSGEFRYYHVYLDKFVDIKDNQKYFSFYYPGEALIGLAGYARYICSDDTEREKIYRKIHRALEFLILQRPVLHKQHFTSLPADGWLMMAINDLWDVVEFRKPLYSGFVFGDADQMCRQQYTEENALYPDYIGAFFYNYGDHPYPDGARGEGLLGAYQLATKIGDQERMHRYDRSLSMLIWSLTHLCNTEESTYAAKNPEKAIGGIRFKYTRQWFRIDTIQHVASLYFKYLRTDRHVANAGSDLLNSTSSTRRHSKQRIVPLPSMESNNMIDHSHDVLFCRLADFRVDVQRLREHSESIVSGHSPVEYRDNEQNYVGWAVKSRDGSLSDGVKRIEPASGGKRGRSDTAICTGYLKEVMTSLENLGLAPYRARVMLLENEGREMGWHTDAKNEAWRLHIPIITTPQAFFEWKLGNGKVESVHLPADGSAWLVRVDVTHRAINSCPDSTSRVHLLMGLGQGLPADLIAAPWIPFTS